MSDEIQVDPPKHPLPDGIDVRDIPIRKPLRWLRLWVIGAACFLSGIVTHAVLTLFAPITNGRAQMAGHACMEAVWYAAGLLLLLVDAFAEQEEGLRGTKILVFCLAAGVAFILVLASMPP
jgi:hypothetical protein